MSNQITVKMIEARDLKAADMGGTSDPFCEVRLLSMTPQHGTVQKTKVVRKTLCPTWNEEFMFNVTNPRDDTVEIKVYDYDAFSSNDLLGVCVFPVSACMGRATVDEWHDLRDPSYRQIKGKGQIHISATYKGEGAYKPQPTAPQAQPGGYAPPPGGYPQQPPPGGYPQQPPMQPGYPQQPPMQPGYPQQPPMQPGYPQQPPMQPGYPQQPPMQPGYPQQPPMGAQMAGYPPMGGGMPGGMPGMGGMPGGMPGMGGMPGGMPGMDPTGMGAMGAMMGAMAGSMMGMNGAPPGFYYNKKGKLKPVGGKKKKH